MSNPKSMGDPSPSDEVIAVARRLSESLEGLSDRLQKATEYGQRTRRITWGLVISMILDLILTVGLAFSLSQSNEASDQAESVRRQQRDTCLSSNESRALNVQLWEYVLSAQPTRERTEAELKRINDFRAFMRKTFAPRDCSNI